MEAARRKASRRAPPPPIRIPPPTPASRSFAASRRSTPRPSSASSTARAPPTPSSTGARARAPPTPSSTRWSPDSYGLGNLFASPPPASSLNKSGSKPSKSLALSGYTSGYNKSPTKRSKPKVTVYTDDKTLKLVKGRRLLHKEVDSPLPAESARTPRFESGGRRPRHPRSPTYNSGRVDPEWKLVRSSKSSARTQFLTGDIDSLE